MPTACAELRHVSALVRFVNMRRAWHKRHTKGDKAGDATGSISFSFDAGPPYRRRPVDSQEEAIRLMDALLDFWREVSTGSL